MTLEYEQCDFGLSMTMDDERRYLFQFCRNTGYIGPGDNIVEIGSYRGGTAKLFATAATPAANIYCIDTWIHTTNVEGGWEDTTRPFPNVHKAKGNSIEISKTFNEPIKLLFIDGDHSYKGVLADLTCWVPKVVKGGHIILHDANLYPIRMAIVSFFGSWYFGERQCWSLYVIMNYGDY